MIWRESNLVESNDVCLAFTVYSRQCSAVMNSYERIGVIAMRAFIISLTDFNQSAMKDLYNI